MKRFDDSTKKLIKNGAALLTSAVVLIAATIAWFSTGGSATTTQLTGIVPNSLANVQYYKLSVSDVLNSATTGTGSTAACTFTSSEQGYTQPTFGARVANAGWTQNNTWDIDSLIPGVYGAYKIIATTNSPKLIIEGIECKGISDSANENTLSDAQIRTVYENVYLYAVALHEVSTSTTDPETNETTTVTGIAPLKVSSAQDAEDCIVCDSFYNLIDKTAANWSISGEQKISTLNVSLTEVEEVTFLLFIGVPGTSVSTSTVDNLRNAHDALRQIGAKLSFKKVLPYVV